MSGHPNDVADVPSPDPSNSFRRIVLFAVVAIAIGLGGVYVLNVLRDGPGGVGDSTEAGSDSLPQRSGAVELTSAKDTVRPAVSDPVLRDLGTLSHVLAVSPDEFARSAENPFRCPVLVDGKSECDWENDPLIARSPREADWMADQGYPSLAQREWAKSQSAEEILAEARKTGVVALWVMGYERQVVDSESPEQVDELLLEMGRLANQSKSLYALERSAALQAHSVELTVARHGWSPSDARARDLIYNSLSRAKDAGIKAALLGDGLALRRISESLAVIPGIRDTPQWPSIDGSRFWNLARDIQLQHADMASRARAQAVGADVALTGFTLDDARVRPVQLNVLADGRPGGVWIEY
jgi:hypothetical protein